MFESEVSYQSMPKETLPEMQIIPSHAPRRSAAGTASVPDVRCSFLDLIGRGRLACFGMHVVRPPMHLIVLVAVSLGWPRPAQG